ncbi:MAG: NUDIX hydrolase, partial [Planctomycetota bacterium]|nr:NUDIX hydrolase [Planctomycetota bacterium]
MVQEPREICRVVRHRGRFLRFDDIAYEDALGNRRTWESVERASDRPAVMTIPWLMPSQRLVLIRQYRPPARGMVIEFPAGLVDEGESAEASALRELREEAGYRGKVRCVIPPTYNTPGLSGEAVYQVFIEIDENAPENQKPIPTPDEGEHIEIMAISRNAISHFLAAEMARGSHFDSKVMAYMLALSSADAGAIFPACGAG